VPNAPQLLSPVALSGVDNIDTTVFQPFFGTSAATPSVAAVIANMLQINPALTFAQIKQILQQTALPFGFYDIKNDGTLGASGELLQPTVIQPAWTVGGHRSRFLRNGLSRLNLSACAGDGGPWWRQRRSRRIEYRASRCRRVATAVSRNAAARLRAAALDPSHRWQVSALSPIRAGCGPSGGRRSEPGRWPR
jgi:hypothetical protein